MAELLTNHPSPRCKYHTYHAGKSVYRVVAQADSQHVFFLVLFSHYDSSKATTATANFYQVQKNAQALFTLFDGVPKPFDEEMNKAFEALYHQDFVHNMDGEPLNKDQWRERLNVFAETGTRILLLKFEVKDEVHFEAGIRVINKNIDVVGYSRGTISGSTLLKIEPDEQSKSSYAMMPGQKVVLAEEHTHIAIAQ